MGSTVAIIGGYLSLGAIAFWPLLPKISHDLFSTPHNAGGDYVLSVWLIAWIPHAVAHGLNPLFSRAIFAPDGINLGVNTSSPLLGLLTVPLSPLLGAAGRTNLLMVLSMPISATAAFLVLRRWRLWIAAAAVGGLVYGFSPYMIGQSLGHVVLVFLPLPPFVASTVVSILLRERSPARNGIQLGLLLAGQYLISPEVMVTVPSS